MDMEAELRWREECAAVWKKAARKERDLRMLGLQRIQNLSEELEAGLEAVQQEPEMAYRLLREWVGLVGGNGTPGFEGILMIVSVVGMGLILLIKKRS